MAARPRGATGPTAATVAAGRYRPEIQGLRAVAVILIVVYHVWFNRVSGGVDVFFLVSGFLLTGQLVRAAERGRIALRPLWARMANRLVPAAAVVLVVTVAAAVWVLPEGRWAQTIREVAASALFLQNWQLAADAVDYTARNNTASVVQHFWSLSVQAQVFLLWPLLVALVALIAYRGGGAIRGHLALALLGVVVTSLSYSVALTAVDQPVAYFHTLTRVWEFALGGLLALGIDRITLSGRTRVVLGWVGVGGLLLCGIVLQVAAVFPGYAALWPTTCAALVIVAGTTGHRRGVDRLLTARPVRYLGDLSYSLYLWHWPLLVLVLVAGGVETLGLLDGAAVIAASVLLATLTYHLVERRPVRPGNSRPYRPVAVGLILVALVLAGWLAVTVHRSAQPVAAGLDHPGAQALAGAPADPAAMLVPPFVSVTDDWMRSEQWQCEPMALFPGNVCAQPVEHPPTRRIAVLGDSHAHQLTAALEPFSERRGWQLFTIVRGACPYSTASEVVPDDPDCLAWNDAVAHQIAELRPDAVVTLASRDVRAGRTEVTPPGFVQRWWQLSELGIPVLAVRDNPRFDFSPPECLQQRGRWVPECGIERAAVYGPDPPWVQFDLPPTVSFLDLADQVCDATNCPAEIGNVLVYLDNNHLTATYAATMAPAVERHLTEVFGW